MKSKHSARVPAGGMSFILCLSVIITVEGTVRAAFRTVGDYVNDVAGAIGWESRISTREHEGNSSSIWYGSTAALNGLRPFMEEITTDVPRGKLALTIVLAIALIVATRKAKADRRAERFQAMSRGHTYNTYNIKSGSNGNNTKNGSSGSTKTIDNDRRHRNDKMFCGNDVATPSIASPPSREEIERIEDNTESWCFVIQDEYLEESSAFPTRFKAVGDTSSRRWGTKDLFWKEDGSLGSGQFATVIAAKVGRDDNNVAVKILPREMDDRTQDKYIEREKSLLGRCSVHPNVVDLFGSMMTATTAYLVMDMAETDLSKLIEDRPRSEGESVKIMTQLVSALEYVHSLRIVHRDLKPANVLMRGGHITPHDSHVPLHFLSSHCNNLHAGGEVLLADFGVAKQLEAGCHTMGGLAGTKSYFAPEQLSEDPQYGTAADMWAVGVLMYEAMHGRQPFCPREEDGYSEIVAAAPSDGKEADQESKGAGEGIELRYDAYDEAEKRMILKGHYTVDPGRVGEIGMDFMAKLLTVSPADRFSAVDASGHTWLGGPTGTQGVDYRSYAAMCIARRWKEMKVDTARRRVVRKGRRVCRVPQT